MLGMPLACFVRASCSGLVWRRSAQEEDDPIIEQHSVAHPGTVNRLKLMPRASHICATWADTGSVHIWDLSAQLANLHQPGSGGALDPKKPPLFTFDGHKDEGYAIDFSEAQQAAQTPTTRVIIVRAMPHPIDGD